MKNFILKLITAVAWMAFLLGGCSLESNSIVPVIAVLLGIAWIALFYMANSETLEVYGE